MLHQVLISLASNCDQTKNLQEAQQRLSQVFYSCHFTKAIWTKPVGNTTSKSLYLNQLLRAETEMNLLELNAWLKQQEQEMGRTAEKRKVGIVSIDIDLLQYDNERYHLRDWERDYIKRLL
jgi:2-amino-4-hydroxy-6-hydroxymethyldihydropteridine diphosphokinase